MSRSTDIMAQRSGAVEYGVALQRGELTGYHTQTPLTELLAAESGEQSDPDTARSLLLRTLMAYLFGRGPCPAHVMNRLYLMVHNVAPEWLKSLSVEDLTYLLSNSGVAHSWRVAASLRGTRVEDREPSEQERIVQQTLAGAHHRQGHEDLSVIVDLDDVLRVGENEMLLDYSERMESLKAGLRFFFYDGPEPERTIVRVFALAKAQYPELILHMNVRELGAIFGVTGASWSERIKRTFNKFLESRGAFGVRAPFQKSVTACEKFRAAQIGNHNRRIGKRHTA